MAGDFTSDGHLDLAVADQLTDDITVLLGNGDGTFQPLPTDLAGDRSSQSHLSLVAGDFRNNGRTDLAVASTNSFNGEFRRRAAGQRRRDLPGPRA